MKIIEIKSVLEHKILKELHALNQDNVPALGSLSTEAELEELIKLSDCLLYTSPSPRDQRGSRMPSSA